MKTYLHILASIVTGCVSIFAFASLVCIPISSTSSAVGLKVCAITAEIKKYKSMIEKKGKDMTKWHFWQKFKAK